MDLSNYENVYIDKVIGGRVFKFSNATCVCVTKYSTNANKNVYIPIEPITHLNLGTFKTLWVTDKGSWFDAFVKVVQKNDKRIHTYSVDEELAEHKVKELLLVDIETYRTVYTKYFNEFEDA